MWYVSCEGWRERDLPIYNIKYAHSSDGINWIREGVVAIDFKYDNGELENYRFNIDSKNVELSVRTTNKPVEIILDPDDWLLKSAARLNQISLNVHRLCPTQNERRYYCSV